MEYLNEDKVKIFDDFYTNENLTLLKIFSFFMDSKQRPMIAVLIKYMELNICMQKSIKSHEIPYSKSCGNQSPSTEEILNEISDYLPKEGKEIMEQLKNAKETFETYSQMMEMMNMMQSDEPNNLENESI